MTKNLSRIQCNITYYLKIKGYTTSLRDNVFNQLLIPKRNSRNLRKYLPMKKVKHDENVHIETSHKGR